MNARISLLLLTPLFAILASFPSLVSRGEERDGKTLSITRSSSSSPSPISPVDNDHWAFRPLKRPALPAIRTREMRNWCRTPIDRFVLAKLEAQGLKPNPPADRRTLLRRVTYDLIGLPPTPEEMEAFLKDKSPDAYTKVVDRLLASPHYGERWARHWLDLVHYGDTHGYDKDKRRDHAWPYRDYVIRAFNTDKPYDRFIREQIAGDHLYPTDPDAIIATGFLAAGPWDFVGHAELREGTIEKEKTRLIDRDDMVTTTIATFNSLTVHCARCHDHKFDPIPQRDYYRLQAVFAGIDRADRPYDTPEIARQRADLGREEARLTTRYSALLTIVEAITSPELTRLDREIATLRQQLAALPPLVSGPAGSPSNGYHSGISPTPDVVKWVEVDLGLPMPISEVRLLPARPTDFPDTPGFGFPVRFRVEASDAPDFAPSHTHILIDQTRADFSNPGDIAYPIPVSGVTARYVRVTATRLWPRTNDYVFALAELQILSMVGGLPVNVARGKPVTALDSIEAGRWAARYLVDNYDSRNPLPDLSNASISSSSISAQFARRSTLERDLAARIQARATEWEAHIPPVTRAEMREIERKRSEVRTRLAALPAPSLVYAVQTHAPRPIYLLRRGDVEQKGEEVAPGSLSCLTTLNPIFLATNASSNRSHNAAPSVSLTSMPESARRASLADWIASPRNMLTWRSIVNRVWHYHFGRGIVDTPSDFGRNGSRPTHPELLDWLATEFAGIAPARSRGSASAPPKGTPRSSQAGEANPQSILPKSLKSLHRLIVLSATYRQSSDASPTAIRRDADNRLLWRMSRRRLEAEEIRDSVLAISGKLDARMGGPGFELFRFKDDHSPIYDFSADGKNNEKNNNKNNGKSGDPATFRRTIYEFVVRSVHDPFMECLDSPDPSILTPVRNTTLTSLQALALRNDPFMIRQSEFLAERLLGMAREREDQIEAAYRLLFGRPPTMEERKELRDYIQRHGLSNACRLLFNTNEFVFLD